VEVEWGSEGWSAEALDGTEFSGHWLKPCEDGDADCYVKESCNGSHPPDLASNWFNDTVCRLIVDGCSTNGNTIFSRCLKVSPCGRSLETDGASAGSGGTASSDNVAVITVVVLVGIALLLIAILLMRRKNKDKLRSFTARTRSRFGSLSPTKLSPTRGTRGATHSHNHLNILEWDDEMV
jgi:hypothetical protein